VYACSIADLAFHFEVCAAIRINSMNDWTIDTVIATHCIADNLSLLYRDKDFDPFVKHLGLRSETKTPSGAL
jgi:hypothetical protein